jgi:DNA-binding transcriptional MerR regulator
MTRTDSANGTGTRNDLGTARDARTWTIAQVAEEFSVTHRTVRHYEELNLISPERRGTARIYHRRDRTRLNLILRGKRLGFPLEEIRTIIDLYDEPTGQASQLRYVLDQLHERRGRLEQRRRDIEDALNELDEFERRCQDDLSRLGDPGKPAHQGRQPQQPSPSPA